MTAPDFSPLGYDLFGEPIRPPGQGPLSQKFDFPPFSVLSAREGDWQERKRCWISQGIKSEIGRGVHSAAGGQDGNDAAAYTSGAPGDLGKLYGKPGQPKLQAGTSATPQIMALAGGFEDKPTGAGGTSIFDPVLCELAYKWFCPPHGQIVDPFAGGSVRGIVAGLLGYRYHGIELREEQVLANREQLAAICPTAAVSWHVGDCRDLLDQAPPADFIFTCPPYGDLERYSDDPADLSTLDYKGFDEAMFMVMRGCYERLKPDRLACFVVGDYRDASGYYVGFPSDTIRNARQNMLRLYNEAVLVTPAGSLPIRTSAQFPSGRKLGKTHQNILVFGKGDPRRAFAVVPGKGLAAPDVDPQVRVDAPEPLPEPGQPLVPVDEPWVGVTDPDVAVCQCGHTAEEHVGDGTFCTMCDCNSFEPPGPAVDPGQLGLL